MKFSISVNTCFEGVMYPIPFGGPADMVRQARRCEALGYDSVWGNDHITTQHYVRELFPDQPPNFYEPMIVMASIGAVTNRLRLGTALTVLPMRDPVYLAKQALTLDQMTAGRFIMAVGVGAYREEFLAWGGSKVAGARRGDMMNEGLEALKLLFEQKSASFEGKYYAFKDVEMAPKATGAHFPLFIGGHNMEAVERAARYGRGWLPGWRPFHEMQERIATLKRRAAELGRDPAEIEIAPQFSMLVGKTTEEAEARYMASGLVAHRKSLAYTGRDLSHQVIANLVGSPDAILEKIARMKAIGIDHCSALMIPAQSIAEMDEQIEWFATAVMPHVSA